MLAANPHAAVLYVVEVDFHVTEHAAGFGAEVDGLDMQRADDVRREAVDWDLSVGVNWVPMKRRELRLNAQALYLDRSTVGSSGVPFSVGANGWVLSRDDMLNV